MNDRNELNEMVKKFQDKFETPTDPEFWINLVEEEVNEVEEAAAHLLKEICDSLYCIIALLNVTRGGEDLKGTPLEERMQDLTERLDDLTPLLEGYSDDNLFVALERVHASNMSKLNDDGQPERRADGKILKGPNYKEPFLGDLIAS